MIGKVVIDMIKNIVIFALAIYSAYITIKYYNVKAERDYLKDRLKEFYLVPEPDTVKVFEAQAKHDTVYLTRYRTIKEKDTIYVFNVVPSFEGEYHFNFTWDWYEFLRVRDSVLIKFDSLKNATASLFRKWRVERPLIISIDIYEKVPEELWYRGYIVPAEFANLTDLKIYNGLDRFRFYLGAGVSFNEKLSPLVGGLIVYKRYLLGLDVALNNINLYFKYRVK
jgi:hypothetical protein